MPNNLTRKILAAHLADGGIHRGEPLALRVDQVLLDDASGTLVVLGLEEAGLERVRVEAGAIYADRNLAELDPREADDHRLLRAAARRWGLWWGGPGTGVGPALHLAGLARPGRLLLGTHAYLGTLGAVGMLALPAGGQDVARALAGQPFPMRAPPVVGVRLTGTLAPWVSAFDVGLELLHRLGPTGAEGAVVEFHGPALAHLGVPERQVLGAMTGALGGLGAIFPSDDRVRAWLRAIGREGDWSPMSPDPRADYDVHEEIDLARVVPMVALPPGPGNVAAVQEIAGVEISQVVVGGPCAPAWRDLAMLARLLEAHVIPADTAVHVEPATRAQLVEAVGDGLLTPLLRAGARLHEPGLRATDQTAHLPGGGASSLRTSAWHGPRGTALAGVFLASPETAAAAALTGRLVDPRLLGLPLPKLDEPRRRAPEPLGLEPPPPPGPAREVSLPRTAGHAPPPRPEPLPDTLRVPILLKLGDVVPTGAILPWSPRAVALRSQPGALAEFCFSGHDRGYARRAREAGEHAIVAGRSLGTGPPDELAALAPRLAGCRVVIALSFAPTYEADLANWGVLPLRLGGLHDYDLLAPGDVLLLENVRVAIRTNQPVLARVLGHPGVVELTCGLDPHRVEALLHAERARHGSLHLTA